MPIGTINNAQGISYSLPKYLYNIKVIVSYASVGGAPVVDDEHRIVDVQIGAPTTVADTENRFFLRFNHSPFAEDDFKATTDANGLLLGITSITDDKSLEILKKISELVKELAKLAAVPVSAPLGTVFDADVDPSPGGIGQAELKAVLSKYGASIDFAPPVAKAASKQDGSAQATEITANCAVGICYRPLDEFVVTMNLPNAGPPLYKQVHLFAPNSASMVAVAIDRAAFVRRDTQLTFINGNLTEVKDKKPSELLALVTAPIDIVKNIASIGTDVLTLRTERVNDEAGLLRAEAARTRAEADLIRAFKELQDQPE